MSEGVHLSTALAAAHLVDAYDMLFPFDERPITRKSDNDKRQRHTHASIGFIPAMLASRIKEFDCWQQWMSDHNILLNYKLRRQSCCKSDHRKRIPRASKLINTADRQVAIDRIRMHASKPVLIYDELMNEIARLLAISYRNAQISIRKRRLKNLNRRTRQKCRESVQSERQRAAGGAACAYVFARR